MDADAAILIVREPWITRFLLGHKTMEIRGTRCCKPIGSIVYLARAGTKTIVAKARFEGCVGPMDLPTWQSHAQSHNCDDAWFGRYRKTYGWMFSHVEPLQPPVAYDHPHGAQTWVRISGVSPTI